MPTIMSHPALTVTKFVGAATHVRRFFQVVGFSPPNNYLVHNSSLVNLVRGVLTRVFYVKGKPPPTPLVGVYASRLSNFRQLLVRRFPSTTRVSYDEFLGFYTGRKKLVYQRAVDSLVASPVNQRDSRVKAFVKAEFINSDDKPDPDPRIISPRDPRFNVELGRFLRPWEHKCYGAIASIFGSPTVLKGLNSAEIGQVFVDKWSMFDSPVAVGLDASRFDQHVSRQALEWEHSVYNAIFRSPDLKRLLKMQLLNDVRGYCRDGKLRYLVEGRRMSGDINTALGNCLLMCALVHAYSASVGVRVSLANNGDDCVVIMETRDLNRFTSGLSCWFLEMGFNMKVEDPVYELEGIEFCQTHPVYTPSGYLMVRNAPKGLAKDCLSLKQMDQQTFAHRWLCAVGEGGLSLTGGLPIYQEFYTSLYRAGLGCYRKGAYQNSTRRHNSVELEGGLGWLSRGMELKYSVIHPRTRYSFWLAFGITPEQQLAIESYYRGVSFVHRVRQLDRPVHLPAWF